MEAGVVLKMQGICMTFPGVKALEGVDLTLKKGEIHIDQVPDRRK